MVSAEKLWPSRARVGTAQLSDDLVPWGSGKKKKKKVLAGLGQFTAWLLALAQNLQDPTAWRKGSLSS